jgi:hypothetical protein
LSRRPEVSAFPRPAVIKVVMGQLNRMHRTKPHEANKKFY